MKHFLGGFSLNLGVLVLAVLVGVWDVEIPWWVLAIFAIQINWKRK